MRAMRTVWYFWLCIMHAQFPSGQTWSIYNWLYLICTRVSPTDKVSKLFTATMRSWF